MALQCQSFRDKFHHIQNLFKFYYELNDIDKIKIAREERGHEERMNERWKESKRESIPTTEQVQIVLTMLQSFEWCGFLATFFLRSFVQWFIF